MIWACCVISCGKGVHYVPIFPAANTSATSASAVIPAAGLAAAEAEAKERSDEGPKEASAPLMAVATAAALILDNCGGSFLPKVRAQCIASALPPSPPPICLPADDGTTAI